MAYTHLFEKKVFNLLLIHLELDRCDISLPELVLDDDYNQEFEDAFDFNHEFEDAFTQRDFNHESPKLPTRPWFDILGWFNPDKPHQVGLRPRSIERTSDLLNCSELELTQLVYAHELGHYFHFKENPTGYLNYPDKRDRTTYVETFAQLCTHAIARNLDSFGHVHQRVFAKLCDCQPKAYTKFREDNLHLMSCYVILEYFLGPKEGELLPLSHLFDLQNSHYCGLLLDGIENIVENYGCIDEIRSYLRALSPSDKGHVFHVHPFQNMINR